MAVIGTVVLCWAMAEVVQSFETFVEEFGDGWDNRWVHATNAEYKGKFEVAELEVVNDPALKVSGCIANFSSVHGVRIEVFVFGRLRVAGCKVFLTKILMLHERKFGIRSCVYSTS